MSTNELEDRWVPIADICAQLRTKSGQEITTENVSLPIKVAGVWCWITMSKWTFETLATIGQARAAIKTAPAVEGHVCAFHRAMDGSCFVCGSIDEAIREANTPPAERPTPITDRLQIAYRKAWSERNEKGAVDELLISHADLERQLAEAREEIGKIRKFATVNGVAELERQLSESKAQLAIADEQLALERGALAEARDEINEWKTLQGWGGTPEIINAFVKGQQSRIHAAQDIERQLAEARAEIERLNDLLEKIVCRYAEQEEQP